MQTFKVVNCPTTELSYTNRAIVSVNDSFSQFEHIAVRYPRENEAFVFSVAASSQIPKGHMAFNLTGRKWASLMAHKEIEAAPYKFEVDSQSLYSVTFYAEFANKQTAPKNIDFDTEDMSKQFNSLFCNQALTVGQLIGFPYQVGSSKIVIELKVGEMQAISYSEDDTGTSNVEIGLTLPNTVYIFEPAEGSDIKLTGKLSGGKAAPQIFQQNWDFSSLGIGGLDEQFRQIFRRAFASRLLPPKLAESIGVEQVRGILLHGPPGTGKTLIARQIGKLLLAREPKVVNGPEILNKYVGESEANIRKLFQEAEEELAKSGLNSGLHMIIFDEIDAICKQRGSNPSSAGVGDNVVNQLLSKIDGVNALTNVLLVGMTNRKDLIDEALLRPGRFEVQIEIGLPNQQGRRQILDIHTKKMRNSNIMDKSVDLDELAEMTKNYTGAELAGLVKAAMSRAINRVVKIDAKVVIDENNIKEIRVTRSDFILAMEQDVKPALGKSEDRMNALARPMISWDHKFDIIQEEITKIINLAKNETFGRPYFVLLRGQRRSGMTTIAANMAKQTEFPFMNIYSNMANDGESEMAKIHHLKKLFQDAGRSELSVIVLDDLEDLFDYIHIGPTFSRNLVTHFRKLKDYILPEGRKLIVICTCEDGNFMKQLKLISLFRKVVDIPQIQDPHHIESFLKTCVKQGTSPLSELQICQLVKSLSTIPFSIGVKTLEIFLKEVSVEETEDRVDKFLELLEKVE